MPRWSTRLPVAGTYSPLEINPLFVLPEGSGVIVGDALAVLR